MKLFNRAGMNSRIDTHIIFILFTFLATHVFLYFSQGIVSNLEAEKYILQADYLLQGRFPSASKYYFYLPIIYLIAAAKKLSFGYGLVVFIQSLFSAFALMLFYKGTKKMFSDRVALTAALALCLFLPFTQWNFFLYSESIFISLSMILFYAVCHFEKQNVYHFLLIIALLTTLVFTRPFGALFIPPLFVYFLFSRYENKKLKLYTVLTAMLFILVMYVSIQAVFHGGEDMDAMKPFIEEHIICFVPQKPEGAKLDLKYYNNGARDIFYYILHNPGHFTKLMLERLYSFFKFTRPWYSKIHNLFLLFFIVPVYLLFFFGVAKFVTQKSNLVFYIIPLILLYSLATTLQCDDWHSRFTMPLLPPIFALAAYGFHLILSKAAKRTP